ncbi:M1 family metallopeptidase [Catelliglobosispora koreensis]|uniref:M1 family metallopeptidase n=1 Tax=Catelliglobosispora koreensis TaxID=129052 RepID=UPI00037847BE|nr:M1 family metallopeptidase [Catelliglobosispora koreensis]
MRRTPALVLCAVLAACTPTPAPLPQPAPETSYNGDYAVYEAGRSEPIADPVYPQHGNAGVDVLHYGLDLAWSPSEKKLTGTATIHLRAAKDLSELTLDFSGALKADSVTLDGVAKTGSPADDNLTVPAQLKKDQRARLVIKYHGTPAVVTAPTRRQDFSTLGLRVTREGSLWTMQEPFGAFTWYPVNDHPSDKALYDIAITVPEGWAGIAGGTPAGRDGQTFRYKSADPMASYLTTLAAGPYRQKTATGPHGLPLTYWYVPGRDDAMLSTVEHSPRYLTWIESKFGPYPFPTAGVLIVPATSAMETQQLVTMGLANRLEAADHVYREGVLVHEFIHHWFGDTVTTNSWDSLWLNEGWTMFGQIMFENERDGVSWEQWEARIRATDAKLRQDFGPPGKPNAADFGRSNMYICPALMLNEIRKQLGDKAFFDMAKAWVTANKNTVQDRASFTAFVTKHTGRDFKPLIDTWLDSPVTPPAT